MVSNTQKTVLGYLRSLLSKYTPLKFGSQSLDDIYNYLKISDLLSTSGQPTAAQLGLIKQAGFNTVVNLAPHNAENSIDDEAGHWAALDVSYIHIPVNFKNPTDADFDAFVQFMQAHQGEKVWVHCAANMRVSAFIYRYRRTILNEDEAVARAALAQIWEPFGVWKKFIG